jgi:hypothetical protein
MDVKLLLKERLQRDGLCTECKFRKRDRGPKAEGDYGEYSKNVWLKCRFQALEYGPGIYCHGCRTEHNKKYFGISEQDPGTGSQERFCLSRRGAVQLCEHVNIHWTAIEDHITRWQEERRNPSTPGDPSDWAGCLDGFNVECQHSGHDTRCMSEEAPTWPRARLKSGPWHLNSLLLVLEWTPHGGFEAFTPTPDDDSYRASELRSMFVKYRQGPARFLLPAIAKNPVPEMTSFDPFNRTSIYHETGDMRDGKESEGAIDVSGARRRLGNMLAVSPSSWISTRGPFRTFWPSSEYETTPAFGVFNRLGMSGHRLQARGLRLQDGLYQDKNQSSPRVVPRHGSGYVRGPNCRSSVQERDLHELLSESRAESSLLVSGTIHSLEL